MELYPCEPAGRQQADCEAWAKTADQIGGLRETLSSFGLPCAELPYDCHDEVNCPTIAQVTAAFLHETTEPAVGAAVGLDDPSERGFHFLQSLLSRFGLPEGSQQTTLDEEVQHYAQGAAFPCNQVQHEPFPCKLQAREELLSHEADFEPWAAGLYHDSTWRSGEKCCDEVILESTTLDLEIEPLCIDQGAPRTQEVEVLTWRRSLRQEVVGPLAQGPGGPNCERCPSEPDFFCLRGCLRFLEGSFWGSSLGRACSHDPHVGERVGEAAHPGPVQASERASAAVLGDASVLNWGHAGSGGDSSGAQHQSRHVRSTQASVCVFAAFLGTDSVAACSGNNSSGVQHQPRDVLQDHAF